MRPEVPRPFKTPLFPVTPVLGAVMCLFLLMSLMARPTTRNFFIVYLVGGVLLYFVYGLWNSKLGKGLRVPGHEDLSQTPDPRID
jgi:APA family basic amino acid/polyamine antiporter